MSGTAVVVAVDGSPSSATALQEARHLAEAQGRPLRGVFVLDDRWADYIGNDWQSSAGARQGFLDYVLGDLQAQAETARRQFNTATDGCADASFTVICGDPLRTLCELMQPEARQMLVMADDAFRNCGRPSVKRLAKDLRRRLRNPVVVVAAAPTLTA